MSPQVRSLSTSPLTHIAAIGDDNGFVHFVDVTNVAEPRIVRRNRLHRTQLSHLTFNESGMFLITASSDGHVFVVDGRATANFGPLGHIDAPGNVFAMSTFLDEKNGGTTKVVVATDSNSKASDTGARTIVYFELSADLAQGNILHSLLILATVVKCHCGSCVFLAAVFVI